MTAPPGTLWLLVACAALAGPLACGGDGPGPGAPDVGPDAGPAPDAGEAEDSARAEGEGEGGGEGEGVAEGEGEPPAVPADTFCPALAAPGEPGEAVACVDLDGDGYGEGVGCRGPDCDDADLGRHADHPERCGNGEDDDCDGETDEECPSGCAECGSCGIDEPGKPIGSACGYSRNCNPATLSPATLQACLASQCSGRLCLLVTFCSRLCEGDGDCAAAVNGPVGRSFRCHGGVCLPGSQQACGGDGDCPEGERCGLGYAEDNAHLGATCAPPRRCGAEVGESCNTDARQGALRGCATGLGCVRGRCVGVCGDDADCASSPALRCHTDVPVSEDGQATMDLCLGRRCDVDRDCGDRGAFCAFTNEPDGSLGGQCAARQAGGVAFGRACDDRDRRCAAGPCVLGECMRRCGADRDCGPDAVCEDIEQCVDEDADTGECQRWQAAPVCRWWPGSGAACAADPECPGGEHCATRYGVRDATVTAEDRCRADLPGGAEALSECGRTGQAPCAAGSCVRLDPFEPATCAGSCACADHCPEGSLCQAVVDAEGTPETARGRCVPRPGSLAGCAESPSSCPEGEVCVANLVPATGGWGRHCLSQGGPRTLGQACRRDAECRHRACRPLGDDPEDSACTQLCADADDCGPGFVCPAPEAPGAPSWCRRPQAP